MDFEQIFRYPLTAWRLMEFEQIFRDPPTRLAPKVAGYGCEARHYKRMKFLEDPNGSSFCTQRAQTIVQRICR
ncbi:MAG: hypothetical protein RMJ48_13440 [Roseiflexaceae bacterium]|nr:hypothetical protein [Roseiflexaceae bacterium]